MAVSKKKAKRKPIGGPFLGAAIFCDTITQDTDGALSAIRIIDKINITLPPDTPADIPSATQRIPVQTWILLMFKSGSARGKHAVSTVIHSPSGKKQPGPMHQVTLSPNPSGGANLKIQFGILIMEGGLFLIDVLLDGKVITRMPLLISVVRGETAQTLMANSKPAARRRGLKVAAK